ncbi:MBL fold metallo-hydrolase [Roseomonas aerophila]|uniref:MBL fold metallo-hydrolase n=1 Tax=Teichococcus aerophilus TaxID=1224513 RepID=A0ABR7RH79_9PROT|nr:MBL fold metallo-hydrolase [Pseudoroseomonas aerophila]MBC9205925.1 MBL fold metallo-hydrolase [Pseudoroseomonas aerophila]
MAEQIPLSPDASAIFAALDDNRDDLTHEISPGLAYRRLALVNVVFVGLPGGGDRGWVLVDAGIPGSKGFIQRAAEARFGAGARPAAIVMTHGHFDHVGVLLDLAEEWDVPVYAHPLEAPYLNGTAAYPPGEPAVGGGLMALMAPLYPRSPVDLGARLRLLPEDGSIPDMPGWRWLHTPGHSVGHVSFWREADRALIAGDAFITTGQESAYAVAVQRAEMHGPPAYFTVDWAASRASVRALAALEPEVVITGHGQAMRGAEMRQALQTLAEEFSRIAVPRRSRYLEHPARAEDRSAYPAP